MDGDCNILRVAMYDPDFDWDEAEKLMEQSARKSTVSGDTPNEPCKRLLQWQAHEAQVNQIRRSHGGEIFTGCWDSASVCLWKSSDFLTPPSPKLQLHVGGFLNDFVEISEHQLLVAVSAGLIPTPGESLKLFDVRDQLPLVTGGNSGNISSLGPVQRFDFHRRGCRALDLFNGWLGSISKDCLAICWIEGGLKKRQLVPNPHGLKEVLSLCWGWSQLYSGGTDGQVKGWDVSTCVPLWSTSVAAGAWVRKMVRDPESETSLVVCHSEGVTLLDLRCGKAAEQLFGGQAYGCAVLGAQRLVALGRQLALWDWRWPSSLVTLTDFEVTVTSLELTGKQLLVGLKNGLVELVDINI